MSLLGGLAVAARLEGEGWGGPPKRFEGEGSGPGEEESPYPPPPPLPPRREGHHRHSPAALAAAERAERAERVADAVAGDVSKRKDLADTKARIKYVTAWLITALMNLPMCPGTPYSEIARVFQTFQVSLEQSSIGHIGRLLTVARSIHEWDPFAAE